jgi:energy-converting hydrogenase B subunit D
MMTVLFECLLIASLIVCALSAFFSKRLLVAVIIYMAYSLIMTIIWALLQSPDLAITEAAVGAGVTGILFVLTLKKIHALKGTKDE